jgi:hypothetical protein
VENSKSYSVIFNLEVKTNGKMTIENLNLVTKLIKQTVLQECPTTEISYTSCEILGIDGE